MRWKRAGWAGIGLCLCVGRVAAQTPAAPHKPAAAAHTPAASANKAAASAHKATTGPSGAHKTPAHRTVTPAHGKAKATGRGVAASRVVQPRATPESRRLASAFVASSQLRPMAQQLAASRSPASYSGVAAYAASHSGDASAAANLALGHAYLMDHRYPEAIAALRLASARSLLLADYADYLQAQSDVQAGHPQDAVPLLVPFAERYPGSLFVPNVPVLLANTYLAENDSADALRVLTPLRSGPAAAHVDFRFALAKSYQAAGNTTQAAAIYREIYLGEPLSFEATQAKSQMEAMGTPPTSGERKQHADGLFNAKQYAQAGAEYRSLQKTGHDLSQADRDFLDIYAAVCDLKLKKLTRGDVSGLPVTGDDSAALKIYLQSELAKNEGKTEEQQALTQQLVTRYPQSRWLEEALYSGGNMFLVKKDLPRAVEDYTTLVQSFPRSTYAPNAHWHAAWLNYRLRRYPEAARLMDEQITSYPAGSEIPGALYWRGRLYEDQEHNFGQAVNYYKAVNAAYANSYYAILARERLAVLGTREAAAPSAVLASVRAVDDPHLTDALPENDPHLLKARLLANAGLNEYIRPEIQLSATSAQWGTLAEAEIYQSFGEDTRALQAMKRSKIPFFSLPVAEVPMAYWRLVFPRPYWDELNSDAQAHGLDPNLVAALIRQESEFNPGAVSRANAYGLMQLLPSTGKSMAKQEGEHRFTTAELLDPVTNLRLGTLDLRKSIDRYGGQMEYALAAYNAGDVPVRQWIAMNDYKDIPEWVESIPYTETRDYVQGILRNREMYRAIYSAH